MEYHPSIPREMDMPTLLDHIRALLEQRASPMHYSDIAKSLLGSGAWRTDGKTPESTVRGLLASAVKSGRQPWLFSTAPGTYAVAAATSPTTMKCSDATDQDRSGSPSTLPQPTAFTADTPITMSFADAAEQILSRRPNGESMHVREITKIALREGLIRTNGLTPEATMHAQIITECQRREKRGEKPRFERLGGGMIGLAAWRPKGLDAQIASHNDKVRESLLAYLLQMDPKQFEELIGRLLTALGFVDVTVTKYSGDGGIDVRGFLVVGDAVRISMAVQVKRRADNLQAPLVQQLRGSLGVHDQGLVISTGGYSSGARTEARRPNASPVALIDGKELVGLLVEHEILIRRDVRDLLQLDVTGFAEASAADGHDQL